MRNKKTPENRGAIQRRRWIKGSPKMTTGWQMQRASLPTRSKMKEKGSRGKENNDRLFDTFEYLEKYCQMFNRYIENIWKIFAVFIKKKLSKRKTMATVNRRKKQSWWEYNHAMPLFSSKQRWVKKKKKKWQRSYNKDSGGKWKE